MRDKTKIITISTAIAVSLIMACLFVRAKKQQDLGNIARTAIRSYLTRDTLNGLNFSVHLMQIPFGSVEMKWDENFFNDKDVYLASLSLRPPAALRKLSKDRIGLDFDSVIDRQNYLPYRSEQTDLNSKRRGKRPRSVEYAHAALYMLRKGNTEDIEDDTRDYASFLMWLMSRDYEKTSLLKTTMNINKTIYLITGKVKDPLTVQTGDQSIEVEQLKLMFLKLSKDYRVINTLPMTIYLIKKGQWYLPIFIDVKKGILRTILTLR